MTASQPLSLHPHPATDPRGLNVTVQIDARRTAFRITGPLGDVVIPAPAAPNRADGLWLNTCFEVFVADATAPGYGEINLSSSGSWAAYRFDGYRAGMREWDIAAPAVTSRRARDTFELEAYLPLDGAASLRLGLSAVIQFDDMTKGYWALAHPPGHPDFHHADCFTLTLGASEPR